jgi:Leu/Phe-tRNA-protein transferase
VTRTALRESRRYALSLNRAFGEVLDACVATHGEGWLLPELVEVFRTLHDERDVRQAAFISMELWLHRADSPMLVAGEIGYLIGSAYASLTGFARVSGAGTVQLTATGASLAAAGVTVWDLGMEIAYKRAVGARVFARPQFLALLERAYNPANPSIRGSMLPVSGLMPARGVLDSLGTDGFSTMR